MAYSFKEYGNATPTQTKSMALGASAPTTVTPDSGYALASVTPSIDTSVIKAENIAEGKQILGVTGTLVAPFAIELKNTGNLTIGGTVEGNNFTLAPDGLVEKAITQEVPEIRMSALYDATSATITANGRHYPTEYGGFNFFTDVIVNVPQAEPIEVSTDAGMTAVLTSANVGKAYKFTGTTGTYTNGDIYIVEEA